MQKNFTFIFSLPIHTELHHIFEKKVITLVYASFQNKAWTKESFSHFIDNYSMKLIIFGQNPRNTVKNHYNKTNVTKLNWQLLEVGALIIQDVY